MKWHDSIMTKTLQWCHSLTDCLMSKFMIYIRTLGSKGTQNSNICTLVDRFYFNAYFTAQNSESNPSRVVVNYLVSTVATCQSGQGSGIVPIHWPVQTKMSCLVTTCLVQSAATASLVNITKTLMYTNASWMYNQTCSCRSRCEGWRERQWLEKHGSTVTDSI